MAGAGIGLIAVPVLTVLTLNLADGGDGKAPGVLDRLVGDYAPRVGRAPPTVGAASASAARSAVVAGGSGGSP